MRSTREQILDILENRQAATARELARRLHLTPANIRHHLKKLARDGRIRAAGTRSPGGRGRPERLFTRSSRGENLGRLAGVLLTQMLEGWPEESAARLNELATRLEGGGTTPSGHITQRLYRAVQRLDELHYQARWEAHADAPRLILGNCPYAEIIDDHPELCQMDAHMLEGLLAESVTQVAKLEVRQGLPLCVFRVGG